MKDFRHTALGTVFPSARRLLGTVALVAACAATPGLAQQAVDSERVGRIEGALAPLSQPRDDAAYINKIIQMEIPQPGGTWSRVTLNYNHTVDLAVFYEFDSANLTPQAKALLTDLGRALTSSRLSGSIFLLAGHTDAKGSKPYNQNLSERRAVEARRFLVENFGIRPDRLIVVGFGEEYLADPARPNDPINRRVEITLLEDIVPLGAAYEAGTAPKTVTRPEGAAAAVAAGELPPECEGVDAGTDPRPADTGLDDFGGKPTDVLCAPRVTEDETAAQPATEPTPTEAPAADATGQATNLAGDQNSAINN